MSQHSKSEAGRLGGMARIAMHGNPGTAEGRKKGGLRSIEIHRKGKTGFKTLRPVVSPKKTVKLAEAMGILAGDGHVGLYQISVVTCATTDYEHALFIRNLLATLFALPVSITKNKSADAVTVLLSSKRACEHIARLGMPSGNKVMQQISPPQWVLNTATWRHAYLRGLIDTDGTVYFDRHKVGATEYASICVAFTSASMPLLDFVESSWKELGYHPTRWGRHVRLRRRSEVLDYVNRVGFSNPKHARKFEL